MVLTLFSTSSFTIVHPYRLLQNDCLYEDEDIRAVIGANNVSASIRFGAGAYD